ncbi:hypothetical protein I553_7296 [Mycobacterium xenopi 4042]|uniref:Uncharacterized protein n=1 Tax=Mycobacterium xenopi 4042 TaxID=1299334 RepID=X8E5R3_MYCXE|nr:hypothetical protein I553_7296 [Mycobacterium xenopi 4042]
MLPQPDIEAQRIPLLMSLLNGIAGYRSTADSSGSSASQG